MKALVRFGGVALLLALAGCATTAPLEPRELRFQASSERTFREAVDLMVAQGYVIRHADLALGRAEGSLARWPEYRLLLQVDDQGGASRVSVSALRGSTALAPYLLDPWLVELQHRLGEAP
ncbi:MULTISPECIES: hypothetical protein [unclassified Halomonas]|uniref:hypothetical protein n=1 Tax=unclassified Halomonas TaxID=2609666 RepID=UPI0020A1CBAE|nr:MULTISPECIES: hypothetical protein [unclassified Halomonas]MCP1316062.1 hypothetical protein [Halomonas sp. 707D7]MCP1328265.1 hypothetical protein [Halomonas sp. 707D4]